MPKRADRKLTEKQVAELVPPRRGHKDYPDGMVPGLVLRVSSSYRKRWFLWFRVEGKNTVRKLGDYPEMTLTDARTLAGAARQSGNPLAFLGGSEDTGATVEALVDHYAKGRLVDLKSGVRSEDRLHRHVLPAWGAKAADSLTRKDMTTLLDRITRNSGPVECLATYQLVMAMLRWNVGKGYIERNPLEGYPPPHKVGRRDRVLSDDELRAIWSATYDLKGSAFGPLVRILILTGLRRGEAAGLHDREIDMEAGEIVIPGVRMKNGLPHRVPVTSMLAREIEPLVGHGYLVSANGGKSAFRGLGKAKQLLDRRLDLKPWALHDIRRTVRSGLGALNVNRDIAERCVAHKVGSQLDQIYDRYQYGPQIADAMERWSGHVRDIVTPPPANVEHLKDRKIKRR